MSRFALLLLFTLVLLPHKGHSDISTYVGVGQNFTFPSTVRIGFADWEVGLLNGGTLGGVKNFFKGSSLYMSFGFGLDLSSTTPAFVGAGGFAWSWFWGLHLRGELFYQMTVLSTSGAGGQLGLWWVF